MLSSVGMSRGITRNVYSGSEGPSASYLAISRVTFVRCLSISRATRPPMNALEGEG